MGYGFLEDTEEVVDSRCKDKCLILFSVYFACGSDRAEFGHCIISEEIVSFNFCPSLDRRDREVHTQNY